MLASASVTPRSSAQSVAPTPAKPTTAFSTRSGLGRFEELREIAADLDMLDAELGGELVERLRPRREGAHGELGIRRDHLERLPPDGSGRPEQGDASLAHVRRLTARVFRHGYALPNARIVK